jgi:hypothetical protein
MPDLMSRFHQACLVLHQVRQIRYAFHDWWLSSCFGVFEMELGLKTKVEHLFSYRRGHSVEFDQF